MKRFGEILVGLLVGAIIGIFYHGVLTPYLPILLIVSVVLLFLRLEEVRR